MKNSDMPRHEHKEALIMWKVLDHAYAKWSVCDGLEFSDYYYVQHRLFKKIKRIKCFGYKPHQHPKYKEFKNKYGIK
jgi:hypothetical protein